MLLQTTCSTRKPTNLQVCTTIQQQTATTVLHVYLQPLMSILVYYSLLQ